MATTSRIELWGGPVDGQELELPAAPEVLWVPHCVHCAPVVVERHLYQRGDDGRYTYAGWWPT